MPRQGALLILSEDCRKYHQSPGAPASWQQAGAEPARGGRYHRGGSTDCGERFLAWHGRRYRPTTGPGFPRLLPALRPRRLRLVTVPAGAAIQIMAAASHDAFTATVAYRRGLRLSIAVPSRLVGGGPRKDPGPSRGRARYGSWTSGHSSSSSFSVCGPKALPQARNKFGRPAPLPASGARGHKGRIAPSFGLTAIVRGAGRTVPRPNTAASRPRRPPGATVAVETWRGIDHFFRP